MRWHESFVIATGSTNQPSRVQARKKSTPIRAALHLVAGQTQGNNVQPKNVL